MAKKKKSKTTITHTIHGPGFTAPVTGTYKISTSSGAGSLKVPAGTVVNPNTLVNNTSSGKNLNFIPPMNNNGNWNIGVSNGHSQHINIDPNGIWTIYNPTPTLKCNVCKKKRNYFAITYEGYSKQTTRRICKSCYTKKMDKFFGIKGGKVEKLLYEKEDE